MNQQEKKIFSLEKWMRLLRPGKAVYSLAELQRLTGLSVFALRRALTRLSKSDFVVALGKSLYANGFHLPALEEIAAVLYPPAYVSLESALFMHGIIQQAPYILTCVTLNKTKTFRTGLGAICYSHLHPRLFFGYIASDRILLAEPEKAALDFIYLQRQNGASPTLDEWNWEHLRPAKLRMMAKDFPKSVMHYLAKFTEHIPDETSVQP